jgi:hypothetical protein
MEKKEKPVETMLVLAMGCLLANVLFHWKAGLYLSLVFGGIGIFSGWLSARIARAWMWVAQGMGWVSNAVLLSVLFLFVVLPVALFRRMRGKDRLTYVDPKATTNFVSRGHLFVGGDLERTW